MEGVVEVDWIIKILLAHRRMRGLSEQQLIDLIDGANSVPALKLIKQHLESGDFKFVHLEGRAPELIQRCVEKARELRWQEHVGELRRHFFDQLGDPFALLEKLEWFV